MLLATLAGALAIALPQQAYGDAFPANMVLNGNAYIPSGTSILRLTDAAGGATSEVGSGWENQQFSTTHDLHAQFTIDLHDHTSSWGTGIGDGLTFVIQDSVPGTAALGPYGGCLGYCGIAPSVAVEFDTWANCCYDPDDNHVGLLENGDVGTYIGGPINPGFALYGEPITAWVDYTAGSHQLAVYVATSSTKPTDPLISATVDLASIVGPSSAYVGFTAATGAANEVSDVTAFSLAATPVGQQPSSISLAPASQTHQTGSPAIVAATVVDGNGNPVPGVVVNFWVSGPNAGTTGNAVTDANGNASFSYTSSRPGSDYLVAAFTDSVGITHTSNEVTVTWTLPPSSCISKIRPSTSSGYGKEAWISGLYRLGNLGTKVAPTSGPRSGPGGFAALGGVYAKILNCSPWVEPGSNPGTSAWVMLQELHGTGHMQIGWEEEAGGSRTTLIELVDPVTESRQGIDAIIGQGSIHPFERCDSPDSLEFLSCAKNIPVPTAGSFTYYTVEYHPAPPVNEKFTVQFTVSGEVFYITSILQQLHDNLQATHTTCASQITGLPFAPTANITCSTPFTLRGTFAMFMQQPGGPRLEVATAPTRFIPNQANVAGEIHSGFSQMPGTSAGPEIFDDVHVYSGGGWVGFGGEQYYNGTSAFDQGPWTLTASSNDPTGSAGQHIELWDDRVG